MEKVQISKTLSYLLRHGFQKHKLVLDNEGFVSLSLLLKLPKLRSVTFEMVQEIVKDDQKGRFKLIQDQQGEWKIRANQGHSIAVSMTLTPIETIETPIIHGTNLNAWEKIKVEGLSTMNRTHIHFSPGLLGQDGVKSGMRKNCTVYIYIDFEKATNGN